ncbi:carbon-nitrogen hydrolase family protein [Vibrio ruber]|uniref:carbon-nitrogen hydrolase family protein n=1 Tax=Vibrio ruber TaxID=184755 RepID=UPI0028934653|nr:carbon-nitrogen hydrolase family protein [Vibrio ruber]WNJ97209.1 carbon-nitrogen hydrolase family protein [Vibrio ruber]
MKTGVTISLAQIPVSRGDLSGNLEHHVKMIKQSSDHHADVVVFPELSLTGYELDLVTKLAFLPEPSSFKELSQASIENEIIVIAGCPLQTTSSSKPAIGAVVCFPNGVVEFYSKQYLHLGEENYCSCGSTDYLFNINGYQIALAICADFTKPEHPQQAKRLGADIYLVSALISEKGYAPDSKILSEIASGLRFPVLLSNHISVTGGWKTCGKSSVWNSYGERVIGDSFKKSGLVLCTISGDEIEATRI